MVETRLMSYAGCAERSETLDREPADADAAGSSEDDQECHVASLRSAVYDAFRCAQRILRVAPMLFATLARLAD